MWVDSGASTNQNSATPLLGGNGFALIIRPQTDLKPGFYNISVAITQVIG